MTLVSILMLEFGNQRGVIVVVVGKRHTATQVQVLNEAACISHSANTLGKGMNPRILTPAIVKWSDKLDSLTLL